MEGILTQYLDPIKIGGKQVHKNLALYPLLSGQAVSLDYRPLLWQKSWRSEIRGVPGRSRIFILRVLGNEGDSASTAFLEGKKQGEFFSLQLVRRLSFQ